MKRLIGLMLLGFLLFFASIACGYFYLQFSNASKPNAWIFLPPLAICLILSAVCMLFANKTHDIYSGSSPQVVDGENDPSIKTIGLQNTLKEHNEIVSQWRKTNHMKDKMTMIKITSNAQKQSSTP